MHITLFGLLWLVTILLWLLINHTNTAKMIAPMFITMIFQCNAFIVVNGSSIGMQIVAASALLVILCITTNKSTAEIEEIRFQKHIFNYLVLFLGYFTISSVLQNVFREKPLNVMMIIVYVGVGLVLLKKRIIISEEELEHIENAIINILLIVGAIQMLTKAGWLPMNSLLKLLVYNDGDPNIIFNSKSLLVFYSTFMEPSYCGTALDGFFALVAMRPADKGNMIRLIMILVSIILTRSTTAYIGLIVIVAGLFINNSRNKSFNLFIIPLLFIVAGVLIFNMDVVNDVIFNKRGTASYRVRSNWNLDALSHFKENPIWGIGYTRSRASSLIYTLLAEHGIVGTLLYCLIIIHFIIELISKKTKTITKSHSVMVLGISLCQFIACPDLNNCVFWLGLYLFILSYKCLDRSAWNENGATNGCNTGVAKLN